MGFRVDVGVLRKVLENSQSKKCVRHYLVQLSMFSGRGLYALMVLAQEVSSSPG